IRFLPGTGEMLASGSIVDLPAIFIAALVTIVLVIGIRESAGFNATMVILKVAIVLFVIGVGVFFINPANWTANFAPYGYGGLSLPFFSEGPVGAQPVGMLAGAATIFFSYIGFVSVSTLFAEANNPQRDVPICNIHSLPP